MDVVDQDWYKNWFGNEYLTVYAHRDEAEAKKLIDLIHNHINLPDKACILDLCCGQGRHAAVLAEAGYRVIGVDLSRTLLETAKFTQNASFIQADMRYLPFRTSFDLLLNLFTSFGYFATDRENLAVFVQFALVMKEKAKFVFDFFNAYHVNKNLIAHHQEQIGNLIIEQERSIIKSRVQKKISLKRNGDISVFYESVKMYYPHEIFSMLEQAGLAVYRVFGDYDGSNFEEDAPRLLIIGGN